MTFYFLIFKKWLHFGTYQQFEMEEDIKASFNRVLNAHSLIIKIILWKGVLEHPV